MIGNCVFLVCGLPASGKSTLIVDVLNHIKLLDFPSRPSVMSVIYDQLIPLDSQKEMIKEQDAWKRSRQEILEAAELLLRKRMHLETEVDAVQNPYYERLLKANRDIVDGAECRGCLIVVDDNLYYSSMRYSWYQLARKLSCGFCQVWLQCPLSKLNERNSSREFSVPWEVIETMSAREEIPSPQKNSWECHSLCAMTDQLSRTDLVNKVWDLIVKAVADPLTPVQSPDEVKSSEVFTQSEAHLIDQMLRKCVTLKIKEAQAKVSNLSAYASVVNFIRLDVLHKFRQGQVRVPSSLNKDPEALEKFVNRLFSSELDSRQSSV